MTAKIACVLFESPPPLEEVEHALAPLGGRRIALAAGAIALPAEAVAQPSDAVAQPSDAIVLPDEATVEVVAAPWPGAEGDSGSLARAVAQRWRWEGAPAAAERHRAFVRVRLPERGAPGDRDAAAGLWRLTDVARALLALPGALACFFPAGEALRSPDFVEESSSHHRKHGLPAFDLWMNLRMFKPDAAPGWTTFDVVGLSQLDLDDLEICFEGPFEPPDRFLFNTAHYLLQKGPVIKTGHTIDGPGGRWRAAQQEKPLAPPSRRTLRFFREGARPPQALLGEGPAGAEVTVAPSRGKKNEPS